MLEAIDLGAWLDQLHWIIAGGESGVGNHSRPMHPDWLHQLRDHAQRGTSRARIRPICGSRISRAESAPARCGFSGNRNDFNFAGGLTISGLLFAPV
jgi:hypothetical protein